MHKILEAKKFSVFYKNQINEKEVEGCKNISFIIYQGEIVGLLGESGCGKSTVAKAIMGLIKTQDGKIIHYSNRPQMIFQDPKNSLNPSMKISRIIEEPLRIKGGYTKEKRNTMVLEIMKKVGLDPELWNRYPDALSGGQRQRVCMATSLILGGKLLVADEPVSALDMTIQAQIINLLKKMQKKLNLSILFISHDLRLVYNICDRVIVMKDGEIVESGLTKEVFQYPKTKYMQQLIEAEKKSNKI
jgi:peptide/nickel transport system ATP-binding protein